MAVVVVAVTSFWSPRRQLCEKGHEPRRPRDGAIPRRFGSDVLETPRRRLQLERERRRLVSHRHVAHEMIRN